MTDKKLGAQTAALEVPVRFAAWANVAGKKEGEGPLAPSFDYIDGDDTFGEAPGRSRRAPCRSGPWGWPWTRAAWPSPAWTGSLPATCSTSASAPPTPPGGQQVPFYGLYGACSTMGEGLILASLVLDGGFGRRAGVVVSSHFCTAERQYRTPLEYGGQRTPTAQWTVTASGAAILAREGEGPRITHVTAGKIVDKGITDTNNMGAAMAPAACDTIAAHLRDTGRSPDFYDLIVTGDLGSLGSQLLLELLEGEGLRLSNHADCGALIFDAQRRTSTAGARGAGCCAAVLTGLLLNGLRAGRWHNLLFCPTGALHSPTSAFQGESVPGICHALAITARKGGIDAMEYVKAFLCGGALCVLGQLLIDRTRPHPGQDPGALRHRRGGPQRGRALPAPGGLGRGRGHRPSHRLRHLLARGAREAVAQDGPLGAFTGGASAAAGGITAALFFGFLIALVGRSKPK